MNGVTKYICNFSADSYKEQLLKIKMLPLSMRPDRNDIIFFGSASMKNTKSIFQNTYLFQTALTVVPAARQMKDFSRKCLFVKLSVLERVALFTYGTLSHKISEEI